MFPPLCGDSSFFGTHDDPGGPVPEGWVRVVEEEEEEEVVSPVARVQKNFRPSTGRLLLAVCLVSRGLRYPQRSADRGAASASFLLRQPCRQTGRPGFGCRNRKEQSREGTAGVPGSARPHRTTRCPSEVGASDSVDSSVSFLFPNPLCCDPLVAARSTFI